MTDTLGDTGHTLPKLSSLSPQNTPLKGVWTSWLADAAWRHLEDSTPQTIWPDQGGAQRSAPVLSSACGLPRATARPSRLRPELT